MTKKPRKVEVAKMIKPAFLSLVGKPANTVAFKVVRQEDTKMTAPRIRKQTPVARSGLLLSLEFPADTPDDEIGSMLEEWGISTYTIVSTDSVKIVQCSDTTTRSDEDSTIRINISDNCVAVCMKPISKREDSEKPHIAVVGMEFSLERFASEQEILSWMAENSVDFSTYTIQNEEQQIVVSRSVDGVDGVTRRIGVEDGVTLLVSRADAQSIPAPFVTAVTETSFGHFGWGALDFTSAMADIEFCDLADTALSVLRRVVDDLLFWSDLPISIRRDLIGSATKQFSDYISTLVDALPRSVVIASRSHHQETAMLKKQTQETKQDESAVERSDTAATETVKTSAEAAAGAERAATGVTRDDVKGMVDDALSPFIARFDELFAKISGNSAAAKPEAAEPPSDSGTASTGEQVVRSVADLAELVKTVAERVGALEGITIVRNDAGDGAQRESKKDVFRGMFGGRQN